jgi:hypothetical protein
MLLKFGDVEAVSDCPYDTGSYRIVASNFYLYAFLQVIDLWYKNIEEIVTYPYRNVMKLLNVKNSYQHQELHCE